MSAYKEKKKASTMAATSKCAESVYDDDNDTAAFVPVLDEIGQLFVVTNILATPPPRNDEYVLDFVLMVAGNVGFALKEMFPL